jgi:prepilin-type N-terminal cleavage/methylation domain-containing protein
MPGLRFALPPRRPSRTQCGLTLLEVLVALIILSVALGIFLTSSRTSQVGNERSRVYGGAATAVVEAHEAVKLMTLAQVKALRNTPVTHSQGSRVTVTATSRDVTAADVGDLSTLDAAKLQFVTLSTAFRNRQGAQVTKSFTTIIYRP